MAMDVRTLTPVAAMTRPTTSNYTVSLTQLTAMKTTTMTSNKTLKRSKEHGNEYVRAYLIEQLVVLHMQMTIYDNAGEQGQTWHEQQQRRNSAEDQRETKQAAPTMQKTYLTKKQQYNMDPQKNTNTQTNNRNSN